MSKGILCFGDSNTYGYCGDKEENKGKIRFSASKRWTGILKNTVSPEFHVMEEGLCGRSIAHSDDPQDSLRGIEEIQVVMEKHKPLSLLIVMLGTNDLRESLQLTAEDIANSMKDFLQLAKNTAVWEKEPCILLIAPPLVGKGVENSPFASFMGKGVPEKSLALVPALEKLAQEEACHFWNPNDLEDITNPVDCMHLHEKGQEIFALALANELKTRGIT